MFDKNLQLLSSKFPHIIKGFENFKSINTKEEISVNYSKNGLPILELKHEGKLINLNSKYNPLQEAERMIEKHSEEIKDYDHVFFYGSGFCYHIQIFIERFPNKFFSIYDPNPWPFYEYLKIADLNQLPNLKNLYIEFSEEEQGNNLEEFSLQDNGKVLILAMASYERIYKEHYLNFIVEFKKTIQKRQYALGAQKAFSKRWTLNSLMNLPTTLTTPNILRDKKDLFKGKPVVIVSAGPSLADEYDHLRFIKENKLAYIFSVGSANKALIANDILPDAICTYDPQAHNHTVFKPLLDKAITSIPMIYGTSVGYETVEKYQGPKLHFITAQDRITPYFIKDTMEYTDDAYSIAIVTLQLLAKLNAKTIVLVGQNFAFKDNLYYSKEVNRGIKSAEVQEEDLKHEVLVKGVNGNLIRTNEQLNQMRLMMERYIEAYPSVEVINTTKDGANIDGANFKSLENLVKTRFKEATVVDDWYHHPKVKIDNYTRNTLSKFMIEINNFVPHFRNVLDVIERIKEHTTKDKPLEINKLLLTFDKSVRKLTSNDFFDVCVKSVTRTQYEKLSNQVKHIKDEGNSIAKATNVVDFFEVYLEECLKVFNEISPHVMTKINEVIVNKVYKSDCGVFAYSSDWKKNSLYADEKTVMTYHCSKTKGTKVNFKFKGTHLRVLAGTRTDCSSNIKIIIDGYERKFSTKNSSRKDLFVFSMNQTAFFIEDLKDDFHAVEMVLDDIDWFVFNGVEVNQDGRVYHPDEVTDFEDLKIGSRIRCHYSATANMVGEFKGIGEELTDFISTESSDCPAGDFYFIAVERPEGEDQTIKLIADRNIQHSISWEVLRENKLVEGVTKQIDKYSACIRLIKGGFAFKDPFDKPSLIDHGLGGWPLTNEWDKYISSSNNEMDWNMTDYTQTWCGEQPQLGMIHPFTSLECTTENSIDLAVFRTSQRGAKELGFNYTAQLNEVRGFRPVALVNQNLKKSGPTK